MAGNLENREPVSLLKEPDGSKHIPANLLVMLEPVDAPGLRHQFYRIQPFTDGMSDKMSKSDWSSEINRRKQPAVEAVAWLRGYLGLTSDEVLTKIDPEKYAETHVSGKQPDGSYANSRVLADRAGLAISFRSRTIGGGVTREGTIFKNDTLLPCPPSVATFLGAIANNRAMLGMTREVTVIEDGIHSARTPYTSFLNELDGQVPEILLDSSALATVTELHPSTVGSSEQLGEDFQLRPTGTTN